MHEKTQLDDPASDHMVERMAEILDQLEECKSIMRATGGPFYKDRFGKPRLHPAALREVALRMNSERCIGCWASISPYRVRSFLLMASRGLRAQPASARRGNEWKPGSS